jgi:ketosteroid isomerase-like protein
MRRAFLAAILASTLLGAPASHAQGTTAASARLSEEQRVLAAEDEYVAAEVARDEATLRRLVDDRFAFNSGKGTVAGKEEFIQSVLKLAMVGQAIRERSVLLEGDIALVFGTADLRFGGEGKEETAQSLRYTSTYVKRRGQWRMLALQMQPRASK